MRYSSYKKENNPFELSQVFLPKGTREILKQKAAELGLPMSRLLAIALDNELDAPVPFVYACALPSTEYIPMAYAEEAQKLARFLLRFPSGTGRDTLMLCRRDIGIPDRETLMLAYRELMEAGLIKEVKVPKKAKFQYPEGYKYTILVNRPLRKKKE